MATPEASEIAVQAGAVGADGDVSLLDKGESVESVDAARRLVAHSAKGIEIIYKGLRSNEKLPGILCTGVGVSVLRHPLVVHINILHISLTGPDKFVSEYRLCRLTAYDNTGDYIDPAGAQ